MDLRRDEDLAGKLYEAYDSLDLRGMRQLANTLREREEDASAAPSRWRRRALGRFNRNYDRVNAEASSAGGDALLAKLDSKLSEMGWAPLGGGLALEAGGGDGSYVPALSSRFEHVLFVDASLCNVVLASKLAEEHRLPNVTCVRADVLNLPFPDDCFRLVHQNGVVEHVSDPQLMISEGVRVRCAAGYYVCVSPNRLSITPEPHFGLPLFGLIPPSMRRVLIPIVRGISESEAGTDPRSLVQLLSFVDFVGGQEVVAFFLPRRLPFTARQTPIRRLVRGALSTEWLGAAVDVALNRVLLPIMPQHILIARDQSSHPSVLPITSAAAPVAASNA